MSHTTDQSDHHERCDWREFTDRDDHQDRLTHELAAALTGSGDW